MTKKYLTTTQAAKICCVTRFTIANWVKAGKLKSNKTAGGHRRILRKDLTSFIKKNHIAKLDQKDLDESIVLERSLKNRRGGEERRGDIKEPASHARAMDVKRQIPHCWEYRFQDPSQHNCSNCLVLKEGVDKCFLITKMFGPERRQCKIECFNCEYFLEYYPMKKNISIDAKRRHVSHIRNYINEREKEKDGPEFVRRGLYTSGKCIASIRYVLAKKKNKK